MTKTLLVSMGTFFLCATMVHAERVTDKDLGSLIDRIASREDTFRDSVDPTLKRSTLRGPNGEVNVERF